jgi:phosphate-selective porin OprO/OprP
MRPVRALTVILLCGVARAQPSPAPDEPLRHELDDLRRRQSELEKRLEAAEHPAKPGKSDPGFSFKFGTDGFIFSTADDQTQLGLHALIQLDGRAYFGDENPAFIDTFLLRRMRPIMAGTLFGIVDFRLVPDFGQGQALIQDGYLDIRPGTWLRLRAGKFKVPLGLELLQTDALMPFVERSLASDLVPQRDIGVMLLGEVGGGIFAYQLAVLQGTPEGTNGPDFDTRSAKDYAIRVFFHPLRALKIDALARFGLGCGATYGREKGTATSPQLPSYKSTGQETFFSYISNTMVPFDATLAWGQRWRVSPQLYYYAGPVGVLAEYVYSSQDVLRSGMTQTLEQQAWNITVNFIMTLEKAGYDGFVPKRPIDFKHLNFGAWELVLRYSELRVDDKAFPTFADPAKSARLARDFGVGINWYLTENVRFMIDFDRTDYQGGAPMGGDREAENALLGRLQLAL